MNKERSNKAGDRMLNSTWTVYLVKHAAIFHKDYWKESLFRNQHKLKEAGHDQKLRMII